MVDAHSAFTSSGEGVHTGEGEPLARRDASRRSRPADRAGGDVLSDLAALAVRSGQAARPDRRRRPTIVGLGGTTRPESASLRALETVLRSMAAAGAETVLLGSVDIDLPMYVPEQVERTPAARRLVAEIARADAVVIATPGYHGGVSGLVKNALDYLEDLRDAPRPYLDGRAVGLIVCADGPQTAGTTLAALRSSVHALRGWPTPLGVSIDTSTAPFGAGGEVLDRRAASHLETLTDQVMGFTYAWSQVI
ncbi:FMN reductase [Parafrankia irregularis]|uniref:FMN reductase n=1 Tax=Parafrankia irregularis TaxID=795642 RepID=A0A0S4QL09_9ACTN|nr:MULTISPECIES: NADPH-dependent FMN reductase [Parafrankia]MBE3205557.1 NAD(P)H-dependent oxidoreductase [Parafrankia sp. CH37]CUU55544.1 FMN reductase [Parafrankia irregularis]